MISWIPASPDHPARQCAAVMIVRIVFQVYSRNPKESFRSLIGYANCIPQPFSRFGIFPISQKKRQRIHLHLIVISFRRKICIIITCQDCSLTQFIVDSLGIVYRVTVFFGLPLEQSTKRMINVNSELIGKIHTCSNVCNIRPDIFPHNFFRFFKQTGYIPVCLVN